MKPVYKRLLIKLSGEGLAGQDGTGINPAVIGGVAQQLREVHELGAEMSVVIGGGSLMGGEGSILGSVIGALLITILYMGGQQMGWPKWVQEMVIGGIIIAAVASDQIRHRRMV